MTVTWNRILELCPELAELKSDAQSIAVHSTWEWYPRWLPSSNIFIKAVNLAARRLGCDVGDIRPVALAGLLVNYRDAKQPALKPPKRPYGRIIDQDDQGRLHRAGRHRRAVT